VADDAASPSVHCALSDCDVEIVQLPLWELIMWFNGNKSPNLSYLLEILKAFYACFTVYFTPQCSGAVSRYKSYPGYIRRVLFLSYIGKAVYSGGLIYDANVACNLIVYKVVYI
jgi:hypothetical protein